MSSSENNPVVLVHGWAGNFRDLGASVQRLATLAEAGRIVGIPDAGMRIRIGRSDLIALPAGNVLPRPARHSDLTRCPHLLNGKGRACSSMVRAGRS